MGRVELSGHVRYNGSTDPIEHLNSYEGQIPLGVYDDVSWCKYFCIDNEWPSLAQT